MNTQATPSAPLKVFISYTGEDLAAHADVVVDLLRRMEWIAVDHRDWAPSGERSVQACKEKLAECAVLVLLVAHRYGWVPSREKGGDDVTSITRMEYEWADEFSIPIVPFVATSEDGWPTDLIERLHKPAVHDPLDAFKADIRDHIVAFFTHEPGSILEKLEGGLRAAAAKLVREATPASQRVEIFPTQLPYLCNRSQQSRLVRQRLQTHLGSRSTRPLLLVVHGNADESHHAFVARVEGTVLPDLLARAGMRRESRFYYLPALEVGTTPDFGGDFRLQMSSKIQQPDFPDDTELLKCLRSLRVRGVVTVLQLCASECSRDPEKILQAVRDYWQGFPDAPPDLLVMCILCVKYDERPGVFGRLRKLVGRSPAASAARTAVEKLSASMAEQPQPHICVLPELKSVTRRDIEDWIAETRAKLRRHVPEAEFNKMFDDGPSLPMDDAIKHLEGVLDSQPRN